jgi:dTDP-glucose pyrophosphorylase
LKAIILAAGKGVRLKPYTNKYQKTMVPIHGKPILEYIVNGLIYAGLKDIIIVVGYRKNQIIDYFQNGKKWNINIEYVEQKNLNGTGGALLLCKDLIENDHFFLTWGDILVPFGVYKKTVNIFDQENEDFILVANYSKDPYKGCAIYSENNYCSEMVEKPQKGSSQTNYNNCGIFILSKVIFEVLSSLKPSKRGEIEITGALHLGICERKWKIRVIEMEKGQFRGDLGDIECLELLRKDKSWLKEINK